MEMEVFHGTDLANAHNIIADNFIYRPNNAHWLGNGVYFYIDLALAKWWTTNPSKKFGVKVKNAAIIKATIEISNTDYLDLRNLRDYKMFSKIFFNEYIPMMKYGSFGYNKKNINIIRCSFCDYLKAQYDLKAIIGNFSIRKQPYLKSHQELSSQLKLFYIETQLCLFDTACIIHKELLY